MVKRLFAVGAGVGMLGATAMGAMAADLKNYPDMFVKDGVFNGYFVVGEAAASVDNLAMTDIAASMMYHKPVSAGAGKVTVEGDVVEVSKSGDLLELYEDIGTVRETLTGSDLEALKSYTMSTDKGTTPVNQFMRLQKQTTTGTFTRTKLFSGSVGFLENDNDVSAEFLYFGDGDYVFEYELEFSEGLESDVVSGTLDDVEDETIWVLGKQFTIVDTAATAASGGPISLTLEMMGGAVRDVATLGTPKSYTIDGQNYNVELSFADSDECKFVVNGETTDLLTDGETDRLADGTEIGVSEVLYQDFAGGIQSCEFFLGADKIEFQDTNTADGLFYTAGVEINEEDIEDAQVRIVASNTSALATVEITDIKYQLKADGKSGDEAYIAAGHGLREMLDEPQGMLHNGWDVTFKGVNEGDSETFQIDANGDDAYTIRFTNLAGNEYNVPFVDNSGTSFVWGDDNDRLWFTEFESSFNGSDANGESYNASYFVIDEDSYVVLSDDPIASADETTYTYVLRFDSLDTSNNEIQFSDLSNGQTYEDTYDAATNATVAAVLSDWNNMSSDSITRLGVGELIVGGKTYEFVVDETTGNVSMDLDQSGLVTNTTQSALVTQYGLVVNMLNGNASSADFGQTFNGVAGSSVQPSKNLVAQAAASGNGQSFNITLSIDSDNLDEATVDEITWVDIQKAASNEVDLDVTTTVTTLNTSVTMVDVEGVDEERGRTLYGLLLVQTEEESGDDTGDELTVTVPKEQVQAQVFIEAGAVSSAVDARGDLAPVTVVDATKLDSEVNNVAAQNLIVVGGPCVNTVAAQLLGNPADCTEGFTPGRARVKLFEHANGNVAMLVAGYTGADTRLAGRVIGHRAGELSGMEVEVEGTTYQDARVGAPMPAAAPAAEVEAPAAGEE